MDNGKNLFQILFLILLVAIMIWTVMYFQRKSYSNSVSRPVKQLTVEEKLRFKGGLQ